MSKKVKRTRKAPVKSIIGLIIVVIISIISGVVININIENGKIEAKIQYAEELVPALIENDRGETIETTEYNGEEIKTVEEVDGGKFEDIDTGTSAVEGDYEDLGWSETYDVSSPEAFKNDTLNKCIIANNRYGAQCVSLARVFWWSYANRDVSTCGTGMAKGMMNCADQNAGNEFEIHWKEDASNIQAGDWLIFDGGQFGHVGMALGGYNNGYVALLGENQGGHSCGANVGGSATNIINKSIKNLIGFYRPKAYIKQVDPQPIPVSKCIEWHVNRGDTMSKIMMECEGTIKYGEIMNEYAKTWFSLIVKPGQSVYDGWTSKSGVGLYENDDIEHRI